MDIFFVILIKVFLLSFGGWTVYIYQNFEFVLFIY